jgi:hypothetical protein
MQTLNKDWHEVDYQTRSSHNQISDRYMAGLSYTQTSSRESRECKLKWNETSSYLASYMLVSYKTEWKHLYKICGLCKM